MVAFSKPTLVEYTCYELGHCWTPSCRQASFDVFKDVFREALKIYGSLYFIAGLLRRRGKAYFRKKFWLELLQSTCFLTVNGTLFIACFCIWRKLVGSFKYVSTISFLPALTASFIAIIQERKSRRGLLAVYMANIATETVWRMLKERGMVRSIHNGEVLLFSVASAVYLYYFKKAALPDGTMSVFKKIFGSEECLSVKEANGNTSNDDRHLKSSSNSEASVITNQKKPYTPVIQWLTNEKQPFIPVIHLLKKFQLWLQNFPKHTLCCHNHSCISHTLQGSIRMFTIGYSIQAVIKLISSLTYIMKRPRTVINALTHKNNREFGAFLATLVGLFRGINCILRRIRNKDDAIHGAVAGFCAGWSMLFYKSQTIALYTASKLVEMIYFKGIEKGSLPYFRNADIILYSLSTAIVFHAAVLEPHSLRPAYWKFLLRVTGNKFANMNRRLLDPFVPNCSKLYPDYWPDYDMRYTNLVKPTS
ncbi:hypothetical protein ACF0H5_007442 [Mactra antiquata]